MHGLRKLKVVCQPLTGVQVADVAACHERPVAGARHDDDMHGVVIGELLETSFQFPNGRDIDGVEHFRTVDSDDSDRFVTFDQNGLVTHLYGSSFESTAHRRDSTFGTRHVFSLKRTRERHRHERRPNADDRPIQFVEPDIGKPCGDLRPDPKRLVDQCRDG